MTTRPIIALLLAIALTAPAAAQAPGSPARIETQAEALKFVDSVNPNLSPGIRSALAKLTLNSGPDWADDELGKAIKAGDYTRAKAAIPAYEDKLLAQEAPLPKLGERDALPPAAAQGVDPFSLPTNNKEALDHVFKMHQIIPPSKDDLSRQEQERRKRMEQDTWSDTQTNRAPPVAAPKPPKMVDRYVLPPEQYDHPYTGRLEIRYNQSLAELAAICPRDAFGGVAIGCAMPNGPGGCRILIGTDAMLRARGWSEEMVERHEIGHCNGWPADHRGARLARDRNWLTDGLVSKPTSPANAAEDEVECRVVANVPAPSTPEVRTESVVISNWTGPAPEMMVEHTLANGRRYLRSEQYAEYRVSRKSSQIQWTGRLRKDRAVTMIGTFRFGKDSNYTEELWRDDRLLNVTVAACEEGVSSPTQAEQKTKTP